MRKLRLLDLFSGVGGFSLGLERSSYFETVAFCEIAAYPRRVLAHRWPGVPIYGDIAGLHAGHVRRDCGRIDAICGGFPCQDASIANTSGIGTKGNRTGLFSEIIRLAGDLGCTYIIMENVPELLNRGFGDVLGALAQAGFNAEWDCFSARECGLDHERDRLFIVAYAGGKGRQGFEPNDSILVAAKKALAKHVYGIAASGGKLVDDIDPLRGSNGVSVAMERRRIGALGNAIVPLIPQMIGQAIGAQIVY